MHFRQANMKSFRQECVRESTALLWDSRCWHYIALSRQTQRERERDLARSATLAACRGSEPRIAVISALLFRQESPFPRAVTKTAWQLLYTQRTWRPSINLDVKLQPCQFSLKQDQRRHSAAISFCLLCVLFHLTSVQAQLPLSENCVSLSTFGRLPSQAIWRLRLLYFKRCSLIFLTMLDDCVIGVKKKKMSLSHQVINVLPGLQRTPTAKLHLAVMYHWCRSMASGSIARISAPLSLTSCSCGVPGRPCASEKHSQHADENHQSSWECACNALSLWCWLQKTLPIAEHE